MHQHYVDWQEKLRLRLIGDTERIKSAQVIARAIINSNRTTSMGKGASLAERLKAAKQEHAKECDAIAAKLDERDRIAPQAYEAGHSIADEQLSDVNVLLSEVRQLSNLKTE